MPAPVIVIPEFMDEGAVARLSAAHPTLYDPALAERQGDLRAALVGAQALIVRTGTEVNGAKRWINLGMRLQPSEFLKPGFAVLLASRRILKN